MRNDTIRLEAFSDGVFAIAITLLVLNVIEIQEADPGERLLPSLLRHWPVFAAYLAGFVTILVCWINHHFVFDLIVRRDTGLVILNGMLLLVVSVVPFVTALLAEHARDLDRTTAVALYGFTFFVVAILAFSIWHYSLKRSLTDPNLDPDELRAIRLMYICGIAYTGAALPIAYVSFPLGLGVYALLFAGFFVPDYLSGGLRRWLIRSRTE